MKRFIAILLVLCLFATPIYASADNSDYAPMDSTAELLAYNDDGMMSEDDTGNYGFKIEREMSAGEKVYIRIRSYSEADYGFYINKVG